jgi:hypothetical protein
MNRALLKQALSDLRRVRDHLEKVEAAVTSALLEDAEFTRGLKPLALSEVEPLVPVGIAAFEWGVGYDVALRRARRGQGVKEQGRWYFTQSQVQTGKRIRLGRQRSR